MRGGGGRSGGGRGRGGGKSDPGRGCGGGMKGESMVVVVQHKHKHAGVFIAKAMVPGVSVYGVSVQVGAEGGDNMLIVVLLLAERERDIFRMRLVHWYGTLKTGKTA